MLKPLNLELRRAVRVENVQKIDVNDYPLIPAEATSFQKELISTAMNYSVTNWTRMWALTQAFEYVNSNEIPGDFVECGVWKGGNLILLSSLQEMVNTKRRIIGFDTFSGMTTPSDYDSDFRGVHASELLSKEPKIDGGQSIHAFASLKIVKQNLREHSCSNIELVKGDVLHTLNDVQNLPNSIAILRLDTDWYESTKKELDVLYPLLSPGGVLLIDDYGHFEGARKAVDEYFKDEKVWMHYIDYSCRLIIKNK